MEKTGCKVICGAPTTLAVKGLMMMMMMKFAPFTIMNNEDAVLDSVITTFNTAVTETASEILANIVRRKNPGSLQKFLICVTEGEK